MPSPASELAVRGSARYECSLDAQLAVGSEHARLVKPDKSAPGAGGPVRAVVVDLSLGGAGFRSPLFFPRTARVSMTLIPPGKTVAIVAELRVRRVMMLDRAPTYYIGAGFEGLTPEQSQAILEVLAHLKASGAKLVPEVPRA